jgi:transposase-like protein
MMKPTRPNIAKGSTYPQEFREEAVRYWLSSGHTLKAVASDLGVTPECLRAWRKQMEGTPTSVATNGDALTSDGTSVTSSGAQTTQTSNELALARELGQLRRELEAMTRQRDILKRLSASSRTTKASMEV